MCPRPPIARPEAAANPWPSTARGHEHAYALGHLSRSNQQPRDGATDAAGVNNGTNEHHPTNGHRTPNNTRHAQNRSPGHTGPGDTKIQKNLADKSSSIPFKKVYKSSPSGAPPREPVTRGPLDPPRSTPSHTRTPQHIVIQHNRTALANPKPLCFNEFRRTQKGTPQ